MTNVIKNVTTTETVNVMMKVVVNVIATTAPVDIVEVESVYKIKNYYHITSQWHIISTIYCINNTRFESRQLTSFLIATAYIVAHC